MTRFPARIQFRLIPAVLAVALCLLAFKAFVFVNEVLAPALGIQSAWAQGSPEAPGRLREDRIKKRAANTDSAISETDAAAGKKQKEEDTKFTGDDYTARQEANLPSQAEIAILRRLSERRKKLDARSKDLDIRENLLKAAETKIEKRIKELKALEARFDSKYGKQMKENRENFQKLVSLYEKMKPKNAAKIFNKMNVSVLAGMAGQMKAQKMAAVLGKMEVSAAKRLTLELARREAMKLPSPLAPGELPKVEN